MKIKGKKISERNIVILPIPRANGEDIILKFAAILDYSEFDAVCPLPTPPIKLVKGGAKVPDYESPKYVLAVTEYSKKKTAWMIIKSMSVTEGLEWEKVDLADSNTWHEYSKELADSGFSDMEQQRILRAVLEANCLSDTKIKEAMDRFLAGEVEIQEASSFHRAEPLTTQSGDPVKIGESVPQA